MTTLVDRVVPARLGEQMRRYVGATWLVQLTDGIALAAGPLAVASLTGSPLLVALAVALHRLPVVVLGPWAAFLADLVNRRLLIVAGDAGRCALLLLLALLLAVGAAPVAVVLLVLAGLGLLEAIADSARGPVLAMLVPDPDLRDTADTRVDAGFVVGTQLAGPVTGALLFTLGSAVPFVVEAVLLLGAVLVLGRVRIAGPARGPAPRGVRRPVRAGLRRIAVDPALSGLVLAGLAAQAAWAAGWSLLVLYAARQLDLGPLGFGLLVTAGAAGGLLGVLGLPWFERASRRLRAAHVVLVLLALEGGGHAVLAATHSPAVAAATVAALGTVGFLGADLARALRRARTAADGSGHVVAAACSTLGLAAMVVGSLAGGVLAAAGGIAVAYWGAAALLLLAVTVLGRRIAAR